MPAYRLTALLASSTLVLAGCGLLNFAQSPAPVDARVGAGGTAPALPAGAPGEPAGRAHDVVLYALGLMETGYRFGGKNPEAGLDCSGMVSHVFGKAAGVEIPGSAADIARRGRPVAASELKPGDLVFFNTRNKPHSHVGIYIGDDRFVHAPNSRGKVRADSLREGWYASRFEEARTYFR